MVRQDRQPAPSTPRHLELRLRATRKAASEARHAVRLLGLPPPLADDAELAISELVTNGVRHAGLGPHDPIRIAVDWSGAWLQVRVRDGPGPATVAASIRPAPGAESGWGLYLVNCLASRWGTTADGYWFELEHERSHSGG